MRPAPLTVIKGGIDRQRTRGGARADTLYDLLNGFVTDSGTVQARPGTIRLDVLDEDTRGLVYFDGYRHTFSHHAVAVPDGYKLNILYHPDSTEFYPIELERIHFAVPMMGALYVVAEFADEQVFHYWLQTPAAWEASTMYRAADLVQPTVENGSVYQASRLGDPYPVWQPNVLRSDGSGDYQQSIIEPTEYNDFYYACVEAIGATPRSGTIEPVWPTEDGAQVTETTENATIEQPTTNTPPSGNQPDTPTRERYDRGDLR